MSVRERTFADLDLILDGVRVEVERAVWRFDPFNSPHEGWAVIREELDELWEHVKANTGRSDDALIEARQIAAMAVRYILDCRRPSPDLDQSQRGLA